jgi:hypothetical protein
MPGKNPAALALQKLSFQKTTPKQRKEAARQAGRASGKARRAKKEANANDQQ